MGVAVPDPRGQRSRRAAMAIGVAAVTIDSALLGLVAPLLPDIEQRTGAGDAALGLALAAYAVPIVLLSLPLGRVADAIGRRVLLAIGLVFVAAGSVLIAMADSIALLVVARMIQGAGSAASWIAALALVSDTALPEKRGETLGIALGATGAGSIAGPALGGVAADAFSFEAPFLAAAAFALLLLVTALIVLPRELPRSGSPVPALPAMLEATRRGTGAWGAAILLGSACAVGLTEVVAPLDLDARLGLSSTAIGLLFACSIAVDALLAPFGGRWGDRRGRLGPAIVGLGLTAISMLFLAVLPGIVGAALALGIWGAGFSLAMAASVPWLDEAFTEDTRGLAYGVQNVLYAGGYVVGPIIGGALLGVGGADLAYGLAAALVGVGAVALCIVGRPERWARAAPASTLARSPGAGIGWNLTTRGGRVMFVRAVRFTDVSAERMDALLARIEESDGPPPDIPSTGLTILGDAAQGTAVVLQEFATADDMEAGARAFEAMDASETPGTRVSVDMCEVKLELSADK